MVTRPGTNQARRIEQLRRYAQRRKRCHAANQCFHSPFQKIPRFNKNSQNNIKHGNYADMSKFFTRIAMYRIRNTNDK